MDVRNWPNKGHWRLAEMEPPAVAAHASGVPVSS
jgi:hypothetical protein